MRIKKLGFSFALLALLSPLSSAQEKGKTTRGPGSVGEILRANAHSFQIKGGKLSGDGAKFLRDSMDGIQFVAFGEVHNRRAVHGFGGALFELLHDEFGFRYLALEEGPYWGKLLSAAARRGGAEAVVGLALKYPNAFHLFSEEEMEMIGRIGRHSKAKSEPIWGLNQVFGASHIYARLIEIAPDKKARDTANRLLGEALQYEKERFQKDVHYLAAISKPQDFKELRATFKPAPNSEADWLIGQIELSNRVYAPYFATPEPSALAFLNSSRLRESNMKHLFSERYREAAAKDSVLPKALAMFGHTHLFRGASNRSEIYTLGNFLSEFSAFNEKESFHIYSAINAPHNFEGFIAPLVKAGAEAAGEADSGTLIDLRPLFIEARRSKSMDPQLRKLIISYDAFLFLTDGESGSVGRFKTPNFRWYPGS